MKILQFFFGISVGWVSTFSALMQMGDVPWYNTFVLYVVGVFMFGVGLRPITGKGTVRYVLLAAVIVFAKAYLFGSNIGQTIIAIGFLLLVLYIIYLLVKFIIQYFKNRNGYPH